MDYREEYKKRVEAKEEQAKVSRAKRKDKKRAEILNNQLELERLKEHSTGLITWKRKGTLLVWEGFVNNEKCFKISNGVYKYSLSTFVDTGDKKDKNPKTSFELNKLQLVAEKIVKKIVSSPETEKK